jgi:hypothetical protein
MDGVLDYGIQPMDRNSYNTWEFYWLAPTTHSHISNAHRTLASGRTMGSYIYAVDIIYMGMGIILYRFNQYSTENAIKPDLSTSVGFINRSILGTLVGC